MLASQDHEGDGFAGLGCHKLMFRECDDKENERMCAYSMDATFVAL